MSKRNEIDAIGSGNENTDAELAMLISDMLARDEGHRPMSLDRRLPASMPLAALDKDVEIAALIKARNEARNEIDALAGEVHQLAAQETGEVEPLSGASTGFLGDIPDNPFAPKPEPRAPINWIGDAIKAQSARDVEAATWDRMAAFTAASQAETVEEAPAQAAYNEHAEDEVTSTAYASEYEYQAPEFEHTEAEYAETHYEATQYEPDAHVRTPMVAAGGGDNSWFGHSPEGLPLWLSTGVPVAAVSVFALGFMLMERPAALDPNLPSVTTTDVALPEASIKAEKITAAVTAPIVEATNDASAAITKTVDRAGDIEIAKTAEIVPAAQTQTVAAASPSPAIFAAPAVSAKIEAVRATSLASAPSLKPQRIETRALASRAARVKLPNAVVARPDVQPPHRALPVRMFTGPIETGSAAALVNALAQQSGPALSDAEQVWLARDMERVLDNELDGRSVSLKSHQGQRVRVALKSSGQTQREFAITRTSEVASLPHDMVLEGGWYAARKDVILHATPALNSGLSHRVIKRDALVERMATYTDRYGDRWYLMGQRGLAIGFISAADVALAATHKAAFGDVYSVPSSVRVHDMRTVYTRCRNGFVGPEGGLVQEMNVCRNAKGHWVAHTDGEDFQRRADLTDVLRANRGTATSIVLAQATGDPITVHAFGNRKFRRRVQGDFVYARAGQTTEQVLPNGDLIRFTFGDTYQQEGMKPVVRVEALGAFPSRLKIKAGWMKAPIGAKLRARPDLLSHASLGEIPAGRSVETLGFLKGVRGEEWALIGRSGVGFGYVPAAQLAAIEGRVSPYAIANVHSREIAELVETVTTCRTVQYETLQGAGSFDACQQADASWALKAESQLQRQFADTPSRLQTAP